MQRVTITKKFHEKKLLWELRAMGFYPIQFEASNNGTILVLPDNSSDPKTVIQQHDPVINEVDELMFEKSITKEEAEEIIDDRNIWQSSTLNQKVSMLGKKMGLEV